MNITIVGDSFSSDVSKDSWATQLSECHSVNNLSQRGISQYRIYTIIKDNLSLIENSDCLIIWHTNPDRIFVNDNIDFPTRCLGSHPTADLVANDALSSKDKVWRQTVESYYKVFFNSPQQELYHRLLVNEIRRLVAGVKTLEYTGFNLNNSDIKSFFNIKIANAGNVNHMNAVGNRIVFETILKDL